MNTETLLSRTVAKPRAPEVAPYYHLWASVMRAGISEATAEIQARAEGISAGICANRYGNALAWMTEERDRGPGSFVWLCDLWDLDPARVRNRARENAANLAASGRAFADLVRNDQANVEVDLEKKPPLPAPAKEIRVCVHCGKSFEAFVSRPDRYCSHRCRDELKRLKSRARVAAIKANSSAPALAYPT